MVAIHSHAPIVTKGHTGDALALFRDIHAARDAREREIASEHSVRTVLAERRNEVFQFICHDV